VTNHGVSSEAVEKMQGVATEFFSLPVEEKLKLYKHIKSTVYSFSFLIICLFFITLLPLNLFLIFVVCRSGPEDNSLEDESEVADALVLLSVSNKSLKDDMEAKSDTERDSENVKIAQVDSDFLSMEF
jgi:isopenicillin N synthase-like dioxygenase